MNFSFLIHGSARKRRQIYWKKNNELEQFDGIVEKQEAQYGFCMLKNCYSLPKLGYFLRTSISLEWMTKIRNPTTQPKLDMIVSKLPLQDTNLNLKTDLTSSQALYLDVISEVFSSFDVIWSNLIFRMFVRILFNQLLEFRKSSLTT